MSAPLLFLGHAADRTGPPIYLLHLLRWLRSEHPEVDFEIALLAGGELEDAFSELAPVSVYRGLPATRCDDLERSLLRRRLEVADRWWALRRERQLRIQMQQHRGCRVVYVNSAPSVELARALVPGGRALISHVHDLEIGITHRLSRQDRLLFLEGARRLFVASEAVGRNLVERHEIDPAVIRHHTEVVDVDLTAPVDLGHDAVRRARAERGLTTDGFVVGASGTLDWRKGVDHFLRLAGTIGPEHEGRPVTFVWVGGSGPALERARAEARRFEVDDHVRFVGVQADPIDWFRLLDVFVLPSREDPFPLVCLEAASVGVPIVSFDNGGMPELLTRGCGLVVAYPDVDSLAAATRGLLGSPEERRKMGLRGRELVQQENHVGVAAPRWWADLEPWLP